MRYRQLIKKVQAYSGFSDSESKDALQLMVESLAVRLSEMERRDFAAELPDELHDIALSVYSSRENSDGEILEQFMELEKIDKNHAKKQIQAAWRAIKDVVSGKEIERIRTQLSKQTIALLH